MIDVHYNDDELTLYAGDHSGTLQLLTIDGDTVHPSHRLKGGHEQTIRTVLVHPTGVITGGEDARLCHWQSSRPALGMMNSNTTHLNSKVHRHSRKNLPHPYSK